MEYKKIKKGSFWERPNRFIALVEIEGTVQTCHVKNTGRCRELLVPGAVVYLEGSDNPNRKTAYSIVAVEKGTRLINMDSQAPNQVWEEALLRDFSLTGLKDPLVSLRREVKYGDSRLDFLAQTDAGPVYMEVKGVTLEEDGAVFFPDAPTERGIKHLHELERVVGEGGRAFAVFVIQLEDVAYFAPNDATHPAFGKALCHAQQAGVGILAYDCRVTPGSLQIGKPVEMRL
ncbi:DNA/RNA nuclease SfsA [Oscillospiraceae bacterium MB08-C2-2]|nr:DNA/RNA nuclease SfsA [Oscillospiraceae bacterium MB08-C2-2]